MKHPGVPIGLRAQVEVVHDPELARRQLKAIRDFLLSVSTRIGNFNSDADVGDETSSTDGLERLVGPLEADMVRVLWTAKVHLSVRQVMWELNAGRAEPLRYTTVQTVMARLANKGALARSREGRADLYRPVASDAAGIAVSRLLAQFGETALRSAKTSQHSGLVSVMAIAHRHDPTLRRLGP